MASSLVAFLSSPADHLIACNTYSTPYTPSLPAKLLAAHMFIFVTFDCTRGYRNEDLSWVAQDRHQFIVSTYIEKGSWQGVIRKIKNDTKLQFSSVQIKSSITISLTCE